MTGPSLNVLDIKDPLQKGIEQGQQQRVSQQTIAINDQTIASNDEKLKADISNLAITQLEKQTNTKGAAVTAAKPTIVFVTSLLSAAAGQGQDAVDKVIKGLSENPVIMEKLAVIGVNLSDMELIAKDGQLASIEVRTQVTPELIKQLTANGGPVPTGAWVTIKYKGSKIVGWTNFESSTNPNQLVGTVKTPTPSDVKTAQKNMQNAYLEIQKNTLKGKSPDPKLVKAFVATYKDVPGFSGAPTVGIKDPPKGNIINIPSEWDKTKSKIDQGKVISGAVKELRKDPAYIRNSKRVDAADTVIAMMNDPGTLTAVAYRPTLNRMWGDTGNIGFMEAETVRKFGSIKDQIETILVGAGTGLLSEKATLEIKSLAIQFKKLSIANLNKVVNQHESTFGDAYGDIYTSKEIKKFFSRYSVNSTNTTGTPPSSKPLGGGTGSKTSGTTPISKPKPTPTPLSNADAEARAWAKKHPNDPRAKEIMKL